MELHCFVLIYKNTLVHTKLCILEICVRQFH